MIKSFLIVLFSFAPMAFAGTWERIDNNTLKYSGHIENGDLERLEAILKPEDKVLYVDSKGGDAEVGVRLALKLLPNQMTVIVDGFCSSSCANYLFTAGYRKEIRKGWVGYHGNITALLAQSWEENAKKMKEEYNLTDEQIEEMHQRLMNSAKLEKDYFAKIGVDQSLFDRTQIPDKGMGNGINYTFLVPKPETFKRYGITNVIGNQDLNYGKDLGPNNLYD